MKIRELLEGGWDSTVTQNTVLKPAIVKDVLAVVDQFVIDFNRYLSVNGQGPIQRGKPTGSSAYHEIDTAEKVDTIYGDIDLQMIAPPVEGASYGQFTTYWNKLADDFVKSSSVHYVDTALSKPGHPIFQIGDKDYVQVDFMWHWPEISAWGAARVTPERGVKGLLTGKMYSVLGELLDMSIQHAGVQLKTIDGRQVPFSKQKGTEIKTITITPETFIYDIFRYEYQQITGNRFSKTTPIDTLLLQFKGNDISEVKIAKLANGIKGLAKSFEMNGMYGKGNLSGFASAQDFLDRFMSLYEDKIITDVNAKKRDKAETPSAKARAESDKQRLLTGLEMVKGYFR